MDSKRTIQPVENIRDGLIAADPDRKLTYLANATRYIEQLNQLDLDLSLKLKPHAGKTFITYHDFAAYFAESYGLNVEYLVGIPSENASPEDVRWVIPTPKNSQLQVLLTEPPVESL